MNVLDVNSHIHWRPRGDTRFRFTGYGGSRQSSGSDDRLVVAYGGTLQGWYHQLSVDATIRFNDWGPFDHYRDFNLTFPFQSIVDISSGWMKPDMEMSRSRVGFRGQYRTMDQYSPDGPTLPGEKGMQWEAMVYTHIGM